MLVFNVESTLSKAFGRKYKTNQAKDYQKPNQVLGFFYIKQHVMELGEQIYDNNDSLRDILRRKLYEMRNIIIYEKDDKLELDVIRIIARGIRNHVPIERYINSLSHWN